MIDMAVQQIMHQSTVPGFVVSKRSQQSARDDPA
jgi:hypothetical protein